jgi:hypothetical protein
MFTAYCDERRGGGGTNWWEVKHLKVKQLESQNPFLLFMYLHERWAGGGGLFVCPYFTLYVRGSVYTCMYL